MMKKTLKINENQVKNGVEQNIFAMYPVRSFPDIDGKRGMG